MAYASLSDTDLPYDPSRMSTHVDGTEMSYNTTRTRTHGDSIDTENGIEYYKTQNPLLDQGIGPADEESGKLDISIFITLLALAWTYVGSQITQLFVSVSALFMAAEFQIDSSQYSWFGVSINLGYAAAAPSAGYLQDMFGRRNLLILGSIVNILGNIIIATAHSFAQTIFGCTFWGMGSAIVELTATAAMAEIVPVRKRGLVLALNGALIIPFTLSLLYAELLGTKATWRWCFYICIIWTVIGFVALLATYVRTVPQTKHESGSRRPTLKSIDYVGILILLAGSTLLITGLQSGGSQYPWNSPQVLSELIIGGSLILFLPVWEKFFASNPIIPGRLFQGQRTVLSLILITFVSEMNFATTSNMGPVILEKVFTPKPITMGLLAFPPSLAMATGSLGVNVLLSAFGGRARELMTVSSILMTTFVAAEAAVTPSKVAMFIIFGTISALGNGGIDMPALTIITAACPEDLIGTAIALMTTLRTIGGSMGYALFFNIFDTKVHNEYPKLVAKHAVEAGLPLKEAADFVKAYFEDPTVAAKLPGVNEQILAAAEEGSKWAYLEGVRLVYYAGIPFGVLAIVLSITLPTIRQLATKKVLVKHRKE